MSATHRAAPSTSPASAVDAVVAASRRDGLVASALLLLGGLLLIGSLFFPYWRLTLHAPQYPKGLHVELYVNRVTGDVAEIDGLNHYIGMAPLAEAARWERSVSLVAGAVLALLLLAAIVVHNRWAALLALPTIVYPAVFLADLYYWLYRFGHSLDPKAPLSTSIKPFTPTILGDGRVGQFRTTASLEEGFLLVLAAVAVVLVALYFHRRAYKPLAEARRRARQVAAIGTRA
jgi:hypothetical protein